MDNEQDNSDLNDKYGCKADLHEVMSQHLVSAPPLTSPTYL